MQKEKVLLEATLCFLCRGDEILLARKTRHIGVGCFNGYGGGLEEGEDITAATIRELFQESGVRASSQDLQKIAVVYFHNTKSDGSVFVCKVHVYILRKWQGEPIASKEMIEPTWFKMSELPLADMMPADPVWLPMALSGKKIVAHARYAPFQKELLGDVFIEEVDHF